LDECSGDGHPSGLQIGIVPSVQILTREQSKSLSDKSATWSWQDSNDQGENAGGHHEKPPSVANVLASGVINYLLMFGLCCAYGMIMFDDVNAKHRGLAVKMNLCTAMVVGVLLAWKCGINVAIGGPDLNPAVFLGGFVATIAEDIAAQKGLEYPDKYRRLGPGGGKEVKFCTGAHEVMFKMECNEYHEELRATVVFAVLVSSAALGLMFFLSGRLHLTRYASYVPTCVMEAFMSCVGYKVFKYALKFCSYEARQFIPAAAIGVPLYFIKAYHIGNPAIVIPMMLFIPLGMFYIIVFGSGSGLSEVPDWMFPEVTNIPFWAAWTDGFVKFGSVNFSAWLKTMPELVIMLVVCYIDCLLKVLGTEGKLPVKVNKDRELQLFGAGNALTTVCGAPVGYMQLKFNVINYGILGNIKDRRGSWLYAILCGITFFTTIEHFNLLPRMFLGILLFFAGAGFVAENLWGSRKYLSMFEWGQIFLILAIFIITGTLLFAVLAGVILTCTDFIMTYAKVPCVARTPKKGAELSSVRRSLMLTESALHMENDWLLTVRLKGFVFFASAQSLVSQLRDIVEAEKNDVPQHQRLRFIVFDCGLMDGMDASTAKTLRKFKSDAETLKVRLLWTSVTDVLEKRLRTQELVDGEGQVFKLLDSALNSIESYVLGHRNKIQKRWVSLHANFLAEHQYNVARSIFDPFKDVFMIEAARHGCPLQFCIGMKIWSYQSLLWTPGMTGVGLFLVHTGSVALFRERPNADSTERLSPVAVYTSGWFLNREALLGMPTKFYALALEDGEVLTWSPKQWTVMNRERPRMTAEMQRTVMRQQDWDFERVDPSLRNSCTKEDSDGSKTLPEDMNLRLQGIHVARSLGNFNLYDPPKKGEPQTLPELPDSIRTDLKIAFKAFSMSPAEQSFSPINLAADSNLAPDHNVLAPSHGEGFVAPKMLLSLEELTARTADPNRKVETGSVLPWERVRHALLYAGIMGASLQDGKNQLSEEEFIRLGNEESMMKLSSQVVTKLQKLFQEFDVDKSGTMETEELAELMSKSFHHDISREQLENIGDEWHSGIEHMDCNRFLALVARLARMHEPDWQLLVGFRELMGTENCLDGSVLTSEMIRKMAPDLSEEDIAEMTWAADWRRNGSSKGLEFCDALTAVLHGLTAMNNMHGALGLQRSCSETSMAFRPQSAATAGTNSPITAQNLKAIRGGENEETTTHEEVLDADAKKLDIRVRMHLLLEEPSSSKAAEILFVVMGVFIMLSVFSMVVEPLLSPPGTVVTEVERQVWYGLEVFFTAVFTLEYVLRLSVCNALGTQTIFRFLIQPSNICDVVAILPFYIELLVSSDGEGFRLLRIVRLLRLTRITRIARLAKRNPLFGPIAMVMVVIWFIYLTTVES